MFPTVTKNDVTDNRLVYLESVSEFRLTESSGFVKVSNLQNFTLSQFGNTVTAAPCGSIVNVPVFHVLLFGPPSQVVQSIVAGVTIGEVTRFHSWGTRTNKGFKNQCVNSDLVSFSISVEYNPLPSVFGIAVAEWMPFGRHGRLSSTKSFHCNVFATRPNRTVVSDTVSRKVLNVSILDSTIDLRHDRLRQGGCVEGGEVTASPPSSLSVREFVVHRSRLFQTPGLILPYSGTPTILDTLISGV